MFLEYPIRGLLALVVARKMYGNYILAPFTLNRYIFSSSLEDHSHHDMPESRCSDFKAIHDLPLPCQNTKYLLPHVFTKYRNIVMLSECKSPISFSEVEGLPTKPNKRNHLL